MASESPFIKQDIKRQLNPVVGSIVCTFALRSRSAHMIDASWSSFEKHMMAHISGVRLKFLCVNFWLISICKLFSFNDWSSSNSIASFDLPSKMALINWAYFWFFYWIQSFQLCWSRKFWIELECAEDLTDDFLLSVILDSWYYEDWTSESYILFSVKKLDGGIALMISGVSYI